MNEALHRIAQKNLALDHIRGKIVGNVALVVFRHWRARTTWQIHPVACMCYSCVVEKVQVPAEHRHQARVDFKDGVSNEWNDATMFGKSA